MRNHSLVAAFVCLLLAAPAAGQVRVTTLAKAGNAIQETREIRLARFADLTEVNHLRVGEELGDGDLLSALAPDLFVELTCQKGTLLRLTGVFRTVVSVPEAADCGLEPLSGGVDVLTDEPTEIGIGGKTLGTKGTRYAVRLSRGAAGPNCQVLVFEGQVEVRGGTEREVISTSQSLTLSRQASQAKPRVVTEDEIQRWARLYASFDLAKAEAAGVVRYGEQQAEMEAELTRLHAAVLKDPTATRPRLELAVAQTANQVGDEALYNLQRTQAVDPGKLKQIRYEKLQSQDPMEYERLERILREVSPDLRRRDVEKRRAVQAPPPDGLR